MTDGAQTHGVALVGYGFAGRTFHAPLIRATPGLALRAVVSRDAAKVTTDLPGMVVYNDVAAALADEQIDLVVIATPNDTHASLARAALAAGKHVVIDKPFALDLAEARDVVQAAEAADRLLCVFHNRRWDSDYLSIRAAIEADTIGNVTCLESHFDRFRPEVMDRWRERDAPGAGLWADLGPHMVDQALQLFGLPDLVLASLAVQRSGALVDDWAHVVLSFGRRRAILHASLLAAGGTHRFLVHGTRGSIVKHDADQQELQLRSGMAPGAFGWGNDLNALVVYGADGTAREIPATAGDQRRFYTGLAAALAGDEAPPVSAIEALAVMAVLDAAERSSREGRAVALALNEDELKAWARLR